MTLIELLFFAQLQEEIGSKSIAVEANGLSISEIMKQFLATYDIQHLLDEAMIAVNEEYAQKDTIVSEGDIIAFIPPVSGG